MSAIVHAVDSSRDLRAFIALPHRIYDADPHWVAPLHADLRRTLDVRRNPYFATTSLKLFTCERDGRTVARAAAVLNPAYRNGDRWSALFGLFEAEDDETSVRILMDELTAWCRDRGATHICGPFNPHHYAEIGLQIDRFDRPTSFFQTHARPYYHRLLTTCGFDTERILVTHRNPDIRTTLAARPVVPVDARDLTVRPIDLGRLDEEFDRIREVYNDAFAGNCYFVPVSHDEYVFSAALLRLVTRPELNVIVEHQGEPVGVLQCVLDVNPLLGRMRSGHLTPWGAARFLTGRSQCHTLIVYAVGIKKRWQRSRVHVLLFNELHRMARGFDALETTWMSPGNPLSIHAAERFGMVADKHFAMLRKHLR